MFEMISLALWSLYYRGSELRGKQGTGSFMAVRVRSMVAQTMVAVLDMVIIHLKQTNHLMII